MPKAQLLELHAQGLGVIDNAHIEFGPGLNVITGETGAGKTLLLGALSLCLGVADATSRYALTGDTHVAAVFQRSNAKEVMLTRETGASGRLRSSIDGVPASAEALREIARELIVLHGQHESLSLRNKVDVLRVLDASARISTTGLTAVRRELNDAVQVRDTLGGDYASRQRELDFMQFQLDELDAAVLISSDELSDTLVDLTRLSELRDGQAALSRAIDELDGEREDAILNRYARALLELPDGLAYDEARRGLTEALAVARDAVHDLARLADPDALDDASIARLEGRATLLQAVARKYGGTIGAAIERREALRRERMVRLEESHRLEGVDVEITRLTDEERRIAAEVLQERVVAAQRLTDAVARQLPRVALTHATLRFIVGGEDGSDVQLLFAPNPGQTEGPLHAMASGGELSRVLLALSLETVEEDVVAVFDEVDNGVGGQVAQSIGDCLHEVARQQQVLAVTHLASVAARADHHFVIDKMISDGVTTTSVREVKGDERVSEISRMLLGDGITAESKALARQMLETRS